MVELASAPTDDSTFGGLVQPGETIVSAFKRISKGADSTAVIGSDHGQRLLQAVNDAGRAARNGKGRKLVAVPDAPDPDDTPAARAIQAHIDAIREDVDRGPRLVELDLGLIDIGENVRVDPGELAELAASIAELGVLQPIRAIGPSHDGRYRAVWGQRRVMASIIAKKATIPALVELEAEANVPGARRSIEQLAENLQRKDLNPIEEAVALRAVLDGDPSLTQEALATRLGRSGPWVSNTLRLLDTPAPVQDLVRQGRLTASHVKALGGLAPKTATEIASRAAQEGYSAHQVERDVAQRKRDEEWRQQRQRESRRAEEAKVETAVRSVQRLAAKKVPLDAEIRVVGYYDKTGAADAIRKAGYTNVKATGEVSPRSSAVDCDCAVWKVETKYDGGFSVSPGCVKPAHVAAKSRLSDHLDQERRRLGERSREALKAKLLEECRGLPRMLARVVLWRALDWSVNDWVRDHKVDGKKPNAWEELTALTDEQLTANLAEYLAKRFQDQNGIKLDWAAIAEELGVAAEPAPAKGKKAAAS